MSQNIVFGQLRSIGATPLRLTTEDNWAINWVTIKALSTNWNSVYVGFVWVSATTGFELKAGEGQFFEVEHPNVIYVLSAGTGDAVCYTVNY